MGARGVLIVYKWAMCGQCVASPLLALELRSIFINERRPSGLQASRLGTGAYIVRFRDYPETLVNERSSAPGFTLRAR